MATAMSVLQGSATGAKKSAPPAKIRALTGALDRMRGAATRNREGLKEAAGAAIHTAETQMCAFGVGMVDGYWGSEKLQMFGVNAPVAVGVAGLGYGLYDAFTGGKGAGHVLALANGVTAGGVTLVGQRLGRKLAQDKTSGKSAAGKSSVGGTREVSLGRRRI